LSDESALKKQNSVLKDILNSSWDGIAIISLDCQFVFVNKALIPMCSYKENELLKMNFLDLLEEDDANDFKKLLKANIEKSYDNKISLSAKRSDGKTIYIRVSVQLMSNKKMFVLNITDITESLTKDKLVNQFIVRIQISKDGIIDYVSDAFYKMTEFTTEELISSNYVDLLSPMTIPFQKDALVKNIASGENWSGKLVLKKHDGSTFNVDAVCNTIENKYGDVTGFAIVMTNTSSFTAQDEAELKKMLVDESEKLAIMSDTMRTVAHEWRQPLNAISLGAQELIFELDFEDDIQKDNIKEKLDDISKNTYELSEVIEHFQAITDLSGSKKKRNIKEMVNEAVKVADISSSIINVEHNETKAFRTYPKELVIALSSILTNAKEITSNVQNPNITIHSYDDGRNIVCELSNNGGHINEDIIDKIFAPYFSTKEIKNGVGLSLYICKVIVELHLRGSIAVQNIDEDVVMFKLKFPKGALE